MARVRSTHAGHLTIDGVGRKTSQSKERNLVVENEGEQIHFPPAGQQENAQDEVRVIDDKLWAEAKKQKAVINWLKDGTLIDQGENYA